MSSNTRHARMLCVITVLFWLSVYTYIPILTPYTSGLGMSYTMAGLVVSSYGFMQMVCRIPIAISSDLLGKRKLFLVAGILSSLISCAGLWLFTQPVLVLIFRGMAGLAVSVWAIFVTLYTSFAKGQDHSKAMGIVNGMMCAGQLCGLVAGGFIAFALDYRSTFAAGAVAAIIALVLSLSIPESVPEKSSGITFRSLIALLGNRELLFFSSMAMILQLVIYSGAFGFLSTVLKEMGMGEIVLGMAPAFTSLPTVLSSFASGSYFKERWGMKRTLVVAFVTLAVTSYLAVSVRHLAAILLLQLLVGFARGLILPSCTALATRSVEPALRSSATGFFQAVYGIGMTLGPLVIGIATDYFTMNAGFLLVSCIALLGAVLVALRPIQD
ncbi:MAG: MFS transporter [Eubacteriales bacterium]